MKENNRSEKLVNNIPICDICKKQLDRDTYKMRRVGAKEYILCYDCLAESSYNGLCIALGIENESSARTETPKEKEYREALEKIQNMYDPVCGACCHNGIIASKALEQPAKE
jgi:hypothetical protein